MTTLHRRQIFTAVAFLSAGLFALGAHAMQSATPASVETTPPTELRVSGTSTLHAWHTKTSDLRFEATLQDPQATTVTSWLAGGVSSFVAHIPIASLRSGKEGLDKNLIKALRASEFNEAKFSLKSYRKTASEGGVDLVEAKGLLSVCGNEREITLPLRVRIDGDFAEVNGTTTLLMTDYGVKPPSFMLGAMKAGNEVTVSFTTRLRLSASTQPVSQR